MRLGKNKKKQWKRCMPGIEEEVARAREEARVEEAAFEVIETAGSNSTNGITFTTAPRTYARKPQIKYPAKAFVDVWSEEYVAPVLSKRKQALIDGISRFKKVDRPIHPGTSYRPLEYDHIDLLDKLQSDQQVKIDSMRAAEKKMEVPVDDEVVNKESVLEDAEDVVDDETPAFVKKDTKVKLRTRKEKKKRIHNMFKQKIMNLEKKKEKSEAHTLRNIPKLKKQIVKQIENEKIRKSGREEKTAKRKEHKAEVKALENVSFVLPSEIPKSLRTLVPEGDIFSEMVEKFDGYKFKSERRKKHKKLTKSVKKSGLVK